MSRAEIGSKPSRLDLADAGTDRRGSSMNLKMIRVRRMSMAVVAAALLVAIALLLVLGIQRQEASAGGLTTFTSTISGTINGQTIAGTGSGTVDTNTGAGLIKVDFSSIPTGFHVIAYGKSWKTTHHPKKPSEFLGAVNFDAISPAGYDVASVQTYGNGDVITTTAEVRTVNPSTDSYTMDLQGTYTGRVDAVGIIPGVERLISIEPGLVRGKSQGQIVFSDSSTLHFTRASDYTLLESTAVLPFSEFLNITVDFVEFDTFGDSLLLATTATIEPGKVGGITELVDVATTPLESEGSRSALPIAGIGLSVAAGALALGGSAWYARRRWRR